MNNFTSKISASGRNSFKSFVATLGLFLALILSSSSFAQTNSYLGLDGGFEGSATIVDGTTNSAPVATNWTKSTTTATIASETGTVRSGNKSLKVTSTSGTLCRVFSPSMTVAASTTKWQVQYYRISTSNANTVQNQTGIYRNGTEQTNGAYTGVAAANTWEKVTYSPTTTTSATTAAADMLVKLLGTGGSTFYDDFVLYESATIDLTAPNSPGSITFSGQTSSSINLSWVAASGGVDGGGYIVVRGTVDPTTAPNANGIYASGNTISGGTVVYQGTGTSFTDSGLAASTSYYYRIYTFDKAYNYSAATTGNSSTASSFTIGWCNLQYPSTQTIAEGSSFTIYGRVYASGLTDSAGQGAGLNAWVGYSTSNVNPNSGSWTWVPLTFYGDDGTNNDEYSGSLGLGITPGTYYYATRFQVGNGAFSYGGTGGVWNSNNGILTVNSNLADWCNLQYPTSGTITQGGNFNVYAQVLKSGVTNAAGQGAGITGWIGYSSSNTNPNTGGWTWIATTYNTDLGNNDEYVGNIGPSLAPGTYYYASRFQISGSTEYRYGGTAGIWSSNSGTLTVNAAVPVVSSGSPTGTVGVAFSYNIVATNTPTSFAISSGTLPTGLSLNTTTGAITGTPTASGSTSVDVTATNAGGTSIAATLSFTIAPGNQTITFGTLSNVTYGVAPYTLTATATSGLTVSYSSSNNLVATISGNTITIVGAGSTNITASQAGDTNYNAASNVIQSLTVDAKPITISGLIANNKTEDGTTTATLSGTASLVGVETVDLSNVTLSGTATATFATASPGTGIAVTVTGFTISGSAVGNYSLTQPTGLTANITGLSAPVATAATTTSDTSFNSNWNAANGASSYVLDVSTLSSFGVTSSSNLSEGFNAGITSPAGWVFNAVTATYTSATNYGVSSPSLKLDATNDRVTTEVYSGSANQLSFWIKGQATDAISSLLVEGYDGSTWTTIENISNLPTVTSLATYTYNSGTTPSLPSNLIQFRFTYTKSVGNLALDDISVDYDVVAPSFVSGYQDLNVGNVTTFNVTGLTPNTNYYYRVRAVNGSAQSANSNIVSVTTLPSTCTWDGNAWSNTVGPDVNTNAIIAGVYTTTDNGSFTAYNLTVNSGSLTVNSGTNITVVNEIVNNLTAANVVLENNANLIQINNVTNTGNIRVRRMSSALMRLDYTLWSSPVDSQNLQTFSPNTLATRFYNYNTTTNLYNAVASPSSTNFALGKGYLIRTPNNFPTTPTLWPGTFIGVPNNGIVNVSLANVGVGQRFNLIGNPYPSPIDMNQFVADNATNITGTLYFWRKTNSTITSPAYCTWAGGTFTSNGEAQVFDPIDVLRTGQGFIVEASSTGSSVQFNNGQRIADNANQFFRNSQSIERNRMWVNLTSDFGDFSQMSVGYIEGATQEIDQFDGKFLNDGTIAINSILNNDHYVIQGRALPFLDTDIVPLSIKIPTDGNYTIAIDHVDGLFANGQTIYIKDNLFNTYNNISSQPYTFTANAGNYSDRFEIVYTTGTLSNNNPVLNSNQVVVYKNNSQVVINSGNVEMSNIKIFDIRGRLLIEKSNINSFETRINVDKTNEMLLVKIISNDGQSVTKKILN